MRLENWPRRLDDAVSAARSLQFEWGVHDCCILAANLIQEITGVDIAAGYRGTYSTEAEATAIIEAAGGFVPLIHSACSQLGWARSKTSLARRGDLVVRILPETGMPSLGVCLGAQSVFPALIRGVAFFPTKEAVNVWRVE